MKVLKFIKKLMVWIFALVFFSFVIAMTVLLLYFNDYGVTVFGDKSLIIMREKVSSEKYKKGDLVIVEKQKLKDIKVGDEVFAYKLLDGGAVTVEFGEVGQVTVGTSAKDSYVTFENGETYSEAYVIGESTKIYNDVGTYLGVLLSRWGFLFIILVPCFLIFIYQLYSLIIEIKYGEEDIKA